jgi:serine/threonine protein kinase
VVSRGAFSTVHRCINRQTGEVCAVKVINTARVKPGGAGLLPRASPQACQGPPPGRRTVAFSPPCLPSFLTARTDIAKIEREISICRMVSHNNIGTLLHAACPWLAPPAGSPLAHPAWGIRRLSSSHEDGLQG